MREAETDVSPQRITLSPGEIITCFFEERFVQCLCSDSAPIGFNLLPGFRCIVPLTARERGPAEAQIVNGGASVMRIVDGDVLPTQEERETGASKKPV